MVGVASTNDESGLEVIEPFDALERLAGNALDVAKAQLADMLMSDYEIIEFPTVGAAALPQSQHIRFRCRNVIVSCDTACVATLLIGTRSLRLFCGANSTTAVPFPLVVERGVDMAFTVSAGTGVAYLIGKGE